MGGTKDDRGKPEFDRLSFQAIAEFNAVHKYGDTKYEEGNWRKGLEVRRLVNASFRHLSKVLEGELIDPESGLLHTAHAGTNCEMLTHYLLNPQEYATFINVDTLKNK